MKKLLLLFFFFYSYAYSESIVSLEDSERTLSLEKKEWNENAKNLAEAMPGVIETFTTPEGLQIIKFNDPSNPGVSMMTIPQYLGGKYPLSFDLINTFPIESFPTSDPGIIKDICNQAISELKTKFSAICVYSITKENFRMKFSISKPNENYLISDLNDKNIFTMSNIEFVKFQGKYANEFIKKTWNRINDIINDKEERIIRLVKDSPKACLALVHYHGIKYDFGKTYYVDDPESLSWDVDFCLKATAQRISAQPEFENKEIVNGFCNRKYDLYSELCKKARLK